MIPSEPAPPDRDVLMSLTQEVIDAAAEFAAAVVRDWKVLAEQYNWTGPGESIDEDHLAELIEKLGRAAIARERGDLAASKELIRAAVRHGFARREDGFDEEMLFREYHLLRRGLWNELRKREPGSATKAIMGIDAEITMATAASLQGFHLENAEIEEDGVVDQIAELWTT